MSEFIEGQFHYNVEELPEMLLVKYSFELEGDSWTNLTFDIYLGEVKVTRFFRNNVFRVYRYIQSQCESKANHDIELIKEDNKSIAIDNAYANRELHG